MAKKKQMKVRVRTKPSAKKGQKSEVSLIGQALRTLGGLGGAAAGGMLGQSSAGSSLGTSFGAAISRWLGQGDYTVSENSIVRSSLRSSNSIPMMHNTGQTITVRHKEYIAPIQGSVDFKVQRFFILQPGDTNTFPWMSGLADKFQQYRIKGMVFHYVPTSGYAVSGTNPAIGSVMMQTSYRANDQEPDSKVEMLNEYWASEASPAETFCHPIECSPKENPFSIHYVRTAPVPAGDSPLLYDLGVTYVATQGMPADNNVVGDLWVTYEIEFTKPIIASNSHDKIPSIVTSGTATQEAPLGVTSLIPFNPGTFRSTLAATVQGSTITFPRGLLGIYMVTVCWQAAAQFSAFSTSVGTLVNCVNPNIGNSQWSTVTGPGTTRAFLTTYVKLTQPGLVATLSLGTTTWTNAQPVGVILTISAM